jgi:hypothetical protein
MNASARWDAFLNQIAGRHRQVAEEAATAALDALAAAGFDPTPIASAWISVDNRLIELETRIDETWNDKVEAAFEAEGASSAVTAAERNKGVQLRDTLEIAREQLHHHVFAEAAHRIHAKALEARRDRSCAKCGTPLDIPISYRALNLKCRSCPALTSFEPGDDMRRVAAFGAHALASQIAWQHWLAMRQADHAIRRHRGPATIQLLKDYERAQIAYWMVYVRARATFEPEMGRDLGFEVRSRMEGWYRMSAEHEQAWVAAGRPREVIG